MLDEECFLPNGSDMNLLQKLQTSFKDHPHMKRTTKQKHGFAVTHFAGEISYNIIGFMEKNR